MRSLVAACMRVSSSTRRAVACCAQSPGERDAGRSDDEQNNNKRQPPVYKRAADSNAEMPTALRPSNSSRSGNSRPHTASGSSADSKQQASNHSFRNAAALSGEAGRMGQRRIPNRSAQSVPSWQQQQDSYPAGRREGGSGTRTAGRGSGRGRGDRALPAHVQASISRTEAIKAAESPEQLLGVVQGHTGDVDHINLSAAYTHAVKVCRQDVWQQQPAAVQQLQQLLHQLAEQLQQQCGARQLANIIWSCGRLSTADTARMLLAVFLQGSNLQQAKPQEVSNVVSAAAALQLRLAPEQWQQLLQAFDRILDSANLQDVSNTLWATAAMGRTVPEPQLQRWLQHFQRVLPDATPQDVSNALWAVATMRQQLPAAQLPQLLRHFTGVLSQANSQQVANTLWACGKLQYAPLQLLTALEQQPQQLQTLMTAAKPQELANMAWACGQLGYKGKLLPGALLQQAVKLQGGRSANGLNMQELCNLCWSVAVLDIRQQVPCLLQLAAATRQVWQDAGIEDLQQLHQVHLWLLDSQLPAPGQGLTGVLSQRQLEQCRASWQQQLAAKTAVSKASQIQRDVFAAVQQLPPGTWQSSPQMEQVTADGAFSIDIAATTASGLKVAIEVDGPSHFIQPDKTPEGATLYRNRALAARGYSVCSIPYWEWDSLRGAEQMQRYLLTKLQAALQATDSKQQLQQQHNHDAAQPALAKRKRRVVRPKTPTD